MKKTWIAALALTGALVTGVNVWAEDAQTAMDKVPERSVIIVNRGAGAGSGTGTGYGVVAEAAAKAPEASQLASVGAFLDQMDLGNHMSYVPYPMGDLAKEHPDLKSPIGQLQVRKNGITMTADVLNFQKSTADMKGIMSGLFVKGKDGQVSAEGAFKTMLFNQMLEKAPTVINEKILEGIADVRKRTGEPIPFSIAHVEFRSVEPLHLVKTDQMVYTTGTRVLAYFDGWIIPMYLKAYVWQEGDNYRFVGIFASDSQKEAALDAGGEMMERIMKN